MKSSGLIAIACAAALTAACGGDARDDDTRPLNETEQFEGADDRADTDDAIGGDDRVGTTGETGTGAVPADVRDFVEKAAHAGMAEVQLGKLASERAQNAEVKKFGQTMVTDHSKANDELKQAVAAYNVPFPTDLDQKHKDLVSKLQGLRGAEFDREYISAMVNGHEEVQGLLEDRVEQARDATAAEARVSTSINQWAQKTKPAVDQHLKMAQQIQDKLQNRNTTN